MGDVICILGMHRSGTSMVARLLNSCGVELGPEEQLVGPDTGNPDGHFEHVGFVRINEAILAHFGGSSACPPVMKAGWEFEPGIAPLFNEATLLVRRFHDCPRWGWKDPRTSLLIPFWKRVIPGLRYVICVRSPLEVARSLEARDGMMLQQGALLWNRYITAAMRDTEGCRRLFTFYEDYFHEPLLEIKRLADFCGLNRSTDPSVVDIISHNSRHNATLLVDLLEDENVLPEHKLFYLSLRALSVDRLLENRGGESRSVAFGRLAELMEVFHSQQKLAQLQADLVKRDLALKGLDQENGSLKLMLESIQNSLTWKLSKTLEDIKERLLPRETISRRLYERLLVRLKKSSVSRSR